MINLRKCKRYLDDTICYFHTWTQIGAVKIHPELAVKDHCYSKTMAIIEDAETGEVWVVNPEDIIFINEGGNNA